MKASTPYRSRSSSRSSRSKKSGMREESTPKKDTKNINAIKEEFMDKLKQREERQFKTVKDIRRNSNKDEKFETKQQPMQQRTNDASNGSMLPADVLKMDKMELLLHVQKLQLSLDQEQEKFEHEIEAHKKETRQKANFELQQQNKKLKESNENLETELESAYNESNGQLLKLKLADKKIEEFKQKIANVMNENETNDDLRNEIDKIKSELNVQTEKRKRMEMLFQDVSEREMKIQQNFEESDNRVLQLEEENLELRMKNENETKGCERIKEINEQLQQNIDQLNQKLKEIEEEQNKDYVKKKGPEMIESSAQAGESLTMEEQIKEGKQVDVLLKLVNESEAALDSKIKELDTTKEKLVKADEANHKLIVESQVLKREILDIKESTTKDKHVSISLTERHKREREQLLKEIESQNREIKKMREEQKKKDHSKEAELEKLEKDVAILTDAVEASKSLAEKYKRENQQVLVEERNKSHNLQRRLEELESIPRADTENDRLCLEIEALVKKNFHLKEENEKLTKKSKEVQKGQCHRGTLTDYQDVINGDLIEIQANLCQNKNDECDYAIDDLANELVLVKNELTTLKSVLEEKDRELSKAKSISTLMFKHQNALEKETVNPELQKLADDLKFQLYSKENQLLEVDLKLQFSERKVGTYESHVNHLRERVQNLETQLEETTKVSYFIFDILLNSFGMVQHLRNHLDDNKLI